MKTVSLSGSLRENVGKKMLRNCAKRAWCPVYSSVPVKKWNLTVVKEENI